MDEDDLEAKDFSFSTNNSKLRLDLPIGVLFDTLCSPQKESDEDSLPFKITVTYKSDSPDEFAPTKVQAQFLMMAMKESAQLRTGSSKDVVDKN